MKKIIFAAALFSSVVLACGCAAFIVGSAIGVAGAVAVSKDTLQADTDKPYESIWNAATEVGKILGTIKQEDSARGVLVVAVKAGFVQVRLIRLTRATTRIRISARRYHLPALELAENFYTKMMEEAK